jgi:hypothetical protein
VTDWRCEVCGRRVTMNYDHVGPVCRDVAAEDDCPGTFSHPSRSSRAMRSFDLTHEMVEVRS